MIDPVTLGEQLAVDSKSSSDNQPGMRAFLIRWNEKPSAWIGRRVQPVTLGDSASKRGSTKAERFLKRTVIGTVSDLAVQGFLASKRAGSSLALSSETTLVGDQIVPDEHHSRRLIRLVYPARRAAGCRGCPVWRSSFLLRGLGTVAVLVSCGECDRRTDHDLDP